jgi:hypothetical protein
MPPHKAVAAMQEQMRMVVPARLIFSMRLLKAFEPDAVSMICLKN